MINRALKWLAVVSLSLGSSFFGQTPCKVGASEPDRPVAARRTRPPVLARPATRVDFVRQVAPLLRRHCVRCHGADKQESGLRLDSHSTAMAGGYSGKVIRAGQGKKSELIARVVSDDPDVVMPQRGRRLTAKEIGILTRWIDQGARWPKNVTLQAPSGSAGSGKRKSAHWAFQPVRRPRLPRTVPQSRVCNGIDAFIFSRLDQAGIRPAPQADRRTLIRRVTLDLIGLPPGPDDVEAFVADDRPNAYGRLVDRLLASPAYGERWARSWLDLCHYADSDGYLTDQLRPVAWRYRAWLVEALNRDLPFDQFTIQQIAGDLLPHASIDQKLATGFLRQTLSNREGGADPEEFRVKQVKDRTMMAGTIWLGLTLGCARCHDHKYDPVTQREFYRLYAFFDNADEINIDAPLPEQREPFRKAKPEYDHRRRQLIAPVAKELAALQARWEKKLLHARTHPGEDHIWDRQWELLGLVWGGGLGEGQLEGWEIVKLPVTKRTALQKDRLLDYFLKSGNLVDPARFKELKLGKLRARLEKLEKSLLHVTRAPTICRAVNPRTTYIQIRGDFRSRGVAVRPGTPSVLPPLPKKHGPDRLRLARWIVSPNNPLTARVTVNRMWQEFLGYGLVKTSGDFGTQGDRPSHPKLLDWLASEFIRRGWSVKQMHRLIVTSATYRQSSAARPKLRSSDPENRLLARQNTLRLSAEGIRDSAMAVGGLLDRKIGGPSVYPPQPESVTMEAYGEDRWPISKGSDRYRRGLYTFLLRTAPFAQGVTFDAPSPSRICTRRERSDTPLQALTLLNDPVFHEAAQALAERIGREHSGSPDQKIRYLFRLCLSRRPTAAEMQRLIRYYRQQVADLSNQPVAAERINRPAIGIYSSAETAAWTGVASIVLNLHEFLTRE